MPSMDDHKSGMSNLTYVVTALRTCMTLSLDQSMSSRRAVSPFDAIGTFNLP